MPVINGRMLAVAAAVVLSEDKQGNASVRLSELRDVLSRKLEKPDDVIGQLINEGVFSIEKVGGGYRIVLNKTPEVDRAYRLLGYEVSLGEFKDALKRAIRELANPITGYADLGSVASKVCSILGISIGKFDEMLLELLRMDGKSFILSYGGSHRVLVGSRYYGLIKVVG